MCSNLEKSNHSENIRDYVDLSGIMCKKNIHSEDEKIPENFTRHKIGVPKKLKSITV